MLCVILSSFCCTVTSINVLCRNKHSRKRRVVKIDNKSRDTQSYYKIISWLAISVELSVYFYHPSVDVIASSRALV